MAENKDENSVMVGEAAPDQVSWDGRGMEPDPSVTYLASEHTSLTPGWYPLEISAGGDGIPREERHWDGRAWGEVREVSEARKEELREQELASRKGLGWGEERLGDDPNWDPTKADTDGDGVSDADELAQVDHELRKRRFL